MMPNIVSLLRAKFKHLSPHKSISFILVNSHVLRTSHTCLCNEMLGRDPFYLSFGGGPPVKNKTKGSTFSHTLKWGTIPPIQDLKGGGLQPLGDSTSMLKVSKSWNWEDWNNRISLEKASGGFHNFPSPSPTREALRAPLREADVCSLKFGGRRGQGSVHSWEMSSKRLAVELSPLWQSEEIQLYLEPAALLTTGQGFMVLWTQWGSFRWKLAKGFLWKEFSRDEVTLA